MKLTYPLLALALFASITACSKKEEDSTPAAAEEDPVVEGQPESVVGVHTAVAAQLGKLHITSYGTSLRLAESTWTSDDWSTQTLFNCFGECENGSITPAVYLDQALNPEKGGPVGSVNEAISMLCVMGALFSADQLGSDGLPVEMDAEVLTVSADTVATLVSSCGMREEQVEDMEGAEFTASVDATTDDSVYDRIITLTVPGDEGETEDMVFYLKNSGGLVNLATYSTEVEDGVSAVTRSLFSYDIVNGIFRFEYFDRTFPKDGTPIQNAGSFSFFRGFRDDNTGEIRFLSNMGSSNYVLNNTFLAVSGNDNETQAGAYFSRTGENSDLEGAFACFDKAAGDFINATGCDEGDSDRKTPWSANDDMWAAVEAKDFADWTMSETLKMPDFDADTMFTLEPNY